MTKTAECWVTNRHAADSDGNWKTTITNAVGDGADVTTLAAPTIEAGNETYVFWQARVLPIGQAIISNTAKRILILGKSSRQATS